MVRCVSLGDGRWQRAQRWGGLEALSRSYVLCVSGFSSVHNEPSTRTRANNFQAARERGIKIEETGNTTVRQKPHDPANSPPPPSLFHLPGHPPQRNHQPSLVSLPPRRRARILIGGPRGGLRADEQTLLLADGCVQGKAHVKKALARHDAPVALALLAQEGLDEIVLRDARRWV